MELVDYIKIVFFLSFIIGIGLVYNPGSDTVGIGVLFLLIFVGCGIALKFNLIKGKIVQTKKSEKKKKNNSTKVLGN